MTRSVTPAAQVIAESMTEAQLQEAVEESLDTFGWLWYHRDDKLDKAAREMNRPDAHRKGKGFYDIFAIRDDMILLIELKTEGGRLSPEQREWRRRALEVCSRAWCEGFHAEGSYGEPETLRGYQPSYQPVLYLLWRPRHLKSGEIDELLEHGSMTNWRTA